MPKNLKKVQSLRSRRTHWFSDQLDSTLEMRLRLALIRLNEGRISAEFCNFFLAETNEGPGGDGQPSSCSGNDADSTQCQVKREREREKERDRKFP